MVVGHAHPSGVVLLGDGEKFSIIFLLDDFSQVVAHNGSTVEVDRRHPISYIINQVYHQINQMGQQTYKIPGPNNSLYEGECDKDGKYQGNGKLKYSDGSVFTGRFQRGVPVQGRFEYKNKDIYEGTLHNSKPQGQGRWIDSKGVFEGNFKDGNFINGTVHYKNGSNYKGFMENGLKHGPASEYTFKDGDRFMGRFEKDLFVEGVYENINGERYEGTFKNGEMNGEGKLYVRGKLVYEGQFLNNEFHGEGKLHNHLKNTLYEGSFRNGKKSGKGTLIDRKKQSKYEGDFEDNQKNGKGTYQFGNRKYVGEFKDGKFDGFGKLTFTSGGYYEGYFENHKKQGKGELNMESIHYKGQFNDDEMEGKGVLVYPNGDTYTGQILKGKKHGEGKYERNDRNYLIGTWKEDLKNGEFEETEGNTLIKCTYKDDEKDGVAIIERKGEGKIEERWQRGKKLTH